MKLLSIQIPTIVGREEQYNRLYEILSKQIGDRDYIEIVSIKDNRELSIGEKRQKLLEECNAKYFVQIDDDDSVSDDYIDQIVTVLIEDPDCVGYLEKVTMNGVEQIACHSNRFSDWGLNQNGFNYVRTIFCKDVIRTEIAKKVGFSNMRFGEDHDFSRRLKQSGLLQKEIFINKIMYYYSHNSLTVAQHKERYGV